MNSERRLRHNRWLLIAVRCCAAGLAAGVPGLTALWADRGLNKGDFYLLEILFALALLVLEIATGRLADRIGKVLTMKCSFLALAAGAWVYTLASGFSQFFLADVLIALGVSLLSGTDEAFLFQSNKALLQNEAHQKWWTGSIGMSFVSMAVSAMIGAQLSVVTLSTPFVFGAGCQVLGFLMCCCMVEPPKSQPTEATAQSGTLREAVSAILLSSSTVRWMVFAPGFLVGLNQTAMFVYAEYLAECNIKLSETGYVFALFNLVAGVTAIMFREIKEQKRGMQIIFVLLLALIGSTFGLASAAGGLAWMLFLPQQVVRSLTGALFSHSINAAIPDAVRATALSVRNAVRVLLYVTALVPWWLWTDRLGRNGMFGVNLLMLSVGGTILWVTTPRVLRS